MAPVTPAVELVKFSATDSMLVNGRPSGIVAGMGPAFLCSSYGLPTFASPAGSVYHRVDGPPFLYLYTGTVWQPVDPTTANGLTAHAGGGQGSATPIVATINRFTTVASVGDSAIMPASAAGMQITIINSGGNSMNVFPASGEQINALGANAAFAIAAGKAASFSCAVSGQWNVVLSA